MNSETSHVNAYLLADRVVGALLESDSQGVVISIDIGGSLFDTVARNSAKTSLHRFVGSPNITRYRSQLLAKSPQLRAVDVIEEPVVFGRVDGIMRTENVSEIFETYAPRIFEVATRSIDSWAIGRPALRHIHFGDPDLTLDQMAGAANSLERDRPIATFYTSGIDRRELLLRLEKHGYRALDLSAREVGHAEVDAASDFGWIAFPSEKYSKVASEISERRSGHAPQFSEWQEVAERNANERQHRSRSVFGLQSNAPPLNRKYSANDIVAEDDCYPVESEGLASWRWAGPRARTRFSLPCAIPGIYQVEIVVIASHLSEGLGVCRVFVEGREIGATIHGTDQGTIQFIGQLDASRYVGYMTVDVVSPGNVKSAGSDPRTLRLNIQSISVSSWR